MTARSEQRILFVDDDEAQAVLVRNLLPAREGYAVHWVACASEARHAVRSGTYDAALVDLGLGEESGIPLISDIAAAGIPAIVLTGNQSADAERQALNAGAADYLVKGEVTGATLRRALRYMAERERARMLLERREQSLRELAVARGHLAAIVQSSDDAIHSQTLEGIVLSWNAGAERLYGYRADEMVGQSLTVLEPPSGPERSWPCWAG